MRRLNFGTMLALSLIASAIGAIRVPTIWVIPIVFAFNVSLCLLLIAFIAMAWDWLVHVFGRR
jgi:hypothetical protein